MITSKIKKRHWFIFILLIVALVSSLIGLAFALALSRGEQYHVVAEEVQSIFCFSMVMSVVLLIIAIMFFERWRRRR
jgi:ABC-type spermidine/putrescine transport system permease subunit II